MKSEEEVRQMLWENRAVLKMLANERRLNDFPAEGEEERGVKAICGVLVHILEEPSKAKIEEYPQCIKDLAVTMRREFENSQKKDSASGK